MMNTSKIDEKKQIEFYKKIGQKIKEFREEKGLTQREIAEKLGISFQQFQKYETGKNRISMDKFFILEKYLKSEKNSLLKELTILMKEIIPTINNDNK